MSKEHEQGSRKVTWNAKRYDSIDELILITTPTDATRAEVKRIADMIAARLKDEQGSRTDAD